MSRNTTSLTGGIVSPRKSTSLNDENADILCNPRKRAKSTMGDIGLEDSICKKEALFKPEALSETQSTANISGSHCYTEAIHRTDPDGDISDSSKKTVVSVMLSTLNEKVDMIFSSIEQLINSQVNNTDRITRLEDVIAKANEELSQEKEKSNLLSSYVMECISTNDKLTEEVTNLREENLSLRSELAEYVTLYDTCVAISNEEKND